MPQAAGDVRDVILRAAARLNVPIRWLPDRIADSNFNLEEPPSKASPWVPVLLGHLQTYVERLGTMPALSPADVHQVQHCNHITSMDMYIAPYQPMYVDFYCALGHLEHHASPVPC